MFSSAPFSALPLSGSGATALVADAGAFVLTGQAAISRRNGPADVGAFAIAGQASVFGLRAPSGAGAFVLTGYPAALDITGVVRLRGRDLSGPAWRGRDTSHSYW